MNDKTIYWFLIAAFSLIIVTMILVLGKPTISRVEATEVRLTNLKIDHFHTGDKIISGSELQGGEINAVHFLQPADNGN